MKPALFLAIFALGLSSTLHTATAKDINDRIPGSEDVTSPPSKIFYDRLEQQDGGLGTLITDDASPGNSMDGDRVPESADQMPPPEDQQEMNPE